MRMYIAIAIMLLLAVFAVGYWLISPLFITTKVDEKLEDIMKRGPMAASEMIEKEVPGAAAATSTVLLPEVVGKGAFEGLEGHRAAGQATLLRSGDAYYVRFEDDFEITNGPDLFVYLGRDGSYDPGAQIASLKGNVGGQNYEVPASIDPSRYNEVWVWCRAFSAAFGKAELK